MPPWLLRPRHRFLPNRAEAMMSVHGQCGRKRLAVGRYLRGRRQLCRGARDGGEHAYDVHGGVLCVDVLDGVGRALERAQDDSVGLRLTAEREGEMMHRGEGRGCCEGLRRFRKGVVRAWGMVMRGMVGRGLGCPADRSGVVVSDAYGAEVSSLALAVCRWVGGGSLSSRRSMLCPLLRLSYFSFGVAVAAWDAPRRRRMKNTVKMPRESTTMPRKVPRTTYYAVPGRSSGVGGTLGIRIYWQERRVLNCGRYLFNVPWISNDGRHGDRSGILMRTKDEFAPVGARRYLGDFTAFLLLELDSITRTFMQAVNVSGYSRDTLFASALPGVLADTINRLRFRVYEISEFNRESTLRWQHWMFTKPLPNPTRAEDVQTPGPLLPRLECLRATPGYLLYFLLVNGADVHPNLHAISITSNDQSAYQIAQLEHVLVCLEAHPRVVDIEVQGRLAAVVQLPESLTKKQS
ncbi:hypothetical protein C8J57DRAFT_1255263 [Mycena rebaudengoi]|nr:hypothetical protein C8J57DRAFT_1255263 [Mycena rebaudengoi]